MSDEELATRIAGVSALADPARRSLYRYVAGQDAAVSRDQAAAGTGLARHTVKFHLDKLVEEGLLATEYRRLSGRRGPGAGRPAKLYRRSDRSVSVSLPERRYDLAGRILAAAVERSVGTGAPVRDAVDEMAAAEGHRLAGSPTAAAGSLQDVVGVLADAGYEPRADGERVILVNCPFHALAREHTALVCGMNLALLGAVTERRGGPGLTVDLDPGPGRCCVTVTAAAT